MEEDLVSVCICTFRRPALLANLLNSLKCQDLDPGIHFEVVVVDNDRNRSAEDTVRKFQLQAEVRVIYDCEPEQNISLTRNRTIRNADGNFIAFIDDDEFPCKNWLLLLYRLLKQCEFDGVLGPVIPEFPSGTPEWLRKGNFFDRRRLPTGTRITERDGRTGNVLFRRSIFGEDELWFDPVYGRTGGEDSDFFRRQFGRGRVFLWCDEAVVYENVPEDRWKISFHLKKYLRLGTINGELLRKMGSLKGLFKYVIILSAIVLLMPLSMFCGKHVWLRAIMKGTYSAGCLSAFFGISFVRYLDYN
ncbi:MAG: glycosyltransferase family 2 protein [Desulfobacterales bacterium]|nr:glycosyltransferase family 2 protein [Desulfobacterales bacterium]